jgi:hypothetical protein
VAPFPVGDGATLRPLIRRFSKADTLVYIDLPLVTHYWWVTKRQDEWIIDGFGCVASAWERAGGGKSTLAKRLAELTRLPLYPLDLIQWRAGGAARMKSLAGTCGPAAFPNTATLFIPNSQVAAILVIEGDAERSGSLSTCPCPGQVRKHSTRMPPL